MGNRRIHVLHLRDSPWVDGPGRTILETGIRIDPAKFRYMIGAFCRRSLSDHPFLQAALTRNFSAFKIRESHRMDITVLPQLRHLIQREKVDIVHTHEVRSDVLGLIAARTSGSKVITTLHGWIENSAKGTLLSRLDRSILRFFDHVIAVSERMREQVLRYGVRPDRVTVLYNALVLEHYRPNRHDRSLRKELNIPDETLLVGNIGRLSPEKGQADFLRAAAMVLLEKKNVRFLLIGAGREEASLRQIAESLRIASAVIFLGYRSDMSRIYNSIDLVVQSSHTEGMPNVVLEALAMKVPVVATDVGGTSEAVIHGRTGLLVPPRQPDKLAQAILRLAKDRDEAQAMIHTGRNLVEAKFCIEERAKRLSLIYDRLATRELASPPH